MSEAVSTYGSSLIGLLVLAMIPMVQSLIAGLAKGGRQLKPGSEPSMEYDERIYRIHRVHLNSTENLAAMAVAVLVAVYAGASSFVVGLLVWFHVILRLAYWYIYLNNIGRTQSGARTIVFALAWFMNVILIVVGVVALI